jgi:hypothetical protein
MISTCAFAAEVLATRVVLLDEEEMRRGFESRRVIHVRAQHDQRRTRLAA